MYKKQKEKKQTTKNKIPDPWGGHLVTDDKKRCADRLDWGGSWGGERERGRREEKGREEEGGEVRAEMESGRY